MSRLGGLLRPTLLLLSIILIIHGVLGSQFAPKNLTTISVWVHYRGLLILGLLFFGNLFCGSCPFIFTRDLARRLIEPTRSWPSFLRNKWLASGLFVLILFSYEYFSLWSSPLLTAVLIAVFFVAILIVDLLYKNASFCKYVCPIGQFNFLASFLSPFEVKAKKESVCASCKTFDCLRGNSIQRGCELKLFIPKKASSFDCTFCMDCKRACPHGNIGISAVMPGRSLADDSVRSGIGRLWQRRDFAFMVILFTFGGLLNAFAMTSPAFDLQSIIGINQPFMALAFLFLIFLGAAPVVLTNAASFSSKVFGKSQHPHLILRFIPVFIPIGFGVWAAHYSFHFLTGALTFVPILWNSIFGAPADPAFWGTFPMGLPISALLPIQTGLLLLGCVVSVTTATEIARANGGIRTALSWQFLCVLLSGFALWVFLQPMEMRGTFFGG